MLSKSKLRLHCRTCLIKLEESCSTNGTTRKFVQINKFPNVEDLMRHCLANDELTLLEQMPFLCFSCLEKWEEFIKLCRVAISSAEKLRNILVDEASPNGETGGLDGTETDNANNKFNEVFISAEVANNNDEIEKYETTSPFYQDSNSPTTNLTQYEVLIPEKNPAHIITDSIELSASPSSCNSDDFNFNDTTQDESKTISPLMKTRSKRNTSSTTVCKIKRKCKTSKTLNVDPSNTNENKREKASKKANRKLRYHCEPCKKFFYEIYRYEGHMKQIHEGVEKPYRCQDCNKTYSKYKNLAYHMAENHMEKPQEIHKCGECNKTFKTNETLRQHMRNQHSDLKKDKKQKENSNTERTICDQCGFIAAHQYTLAQHIKNKHTEGQKIKCEHCPKIFKSQSYLKYHMLSHNPTSAAKPFQCTECPMAFGRRTLLNIHKRTHLKYNERLKCDFEGCSVRFVKPADKRLHMRLVHLKVKKHICDYCGEAFGAMQTLRHHRYIHTGEKPYKCSVCGQGFRQQTAMKTHRKAHFAKQEMPQQQDICNLSKVDVPLA